MSFVQQLPLEAGRVYRTRDLAQWTGDTTRLARRLVEEGSLVALARGLFLHPRRGRFGPVPPTDDQLMHAFLGHTPFVFTGPERWNALGLGTLTVFAHTLVYNARRAGRILLGGRPFLLRRVSFPLPSPPPEWFVIDLLEHAEQAASSQAELIAEVSLAAAQGRFDRALLLKMARDYGTVRTARLLRVALSPGRP